MYCFGIGAESYYVNIVKCQNISSPSIVKVYLSIPQQYVDFRKAFPLLPALWALILVRGFPPQSQTVAAKVMAASQGGWVHQDVVAAVTEEFIF